MRLCLGRFLHGSAGCRVEPCFDCLLSFHLRRCPIPALVGLGRSGSPPHFSIIGLMTVCAEYSRRICATEGYRRSVRISTRQKRLQPSARPFLPYRTGRTCSHSRRMQQCPPTYPARHRGCRQKPSASCPTDRRHSRFLPFPRPNRYGRRRQSPVSRNFHTRCTARPCRPRRGHVRDVPSCRVLLYVRRRQPMPRL